MLVAAESRAATVQPIPLLLCCHRGYMDNSGLSWPTLSVGTMDQVERY